MKAKEWLDAWTAFAAAGIARQKYEGEPDSVVGDADEMMVEWEKRADVRQIGLEDPHEPCPCGCGQRYFTERWERINGCEKYRKERCG